MNLVGKIFTVFIFVTAIVMAAIGGAVLRGEKNWRPIALQNSKDLATAQQENKAALEKNQAVNKNLKAERDLQARHLAKLEAEDVALAKDHTADKESVTAKEKAFHDGIVAVRVKQEQAAELRSKIATLSESIKTNRTERDKQLKELLSLKDELLSTVDELTRLTKVADELARQLIEAKSGLAERMPARPAQR